jgi:hypothetical protein
MPTGLGDTAQAKNPEKKVEFGLKWADKGLKGVVKAGEKAQKKRGIEGNVGGIIKNWGTRADKGVNAAEKGVTKASRAVDKTISKSKVGRAAKDAYGKAAREQDKLIEKGFSKCGARGCQVVKGVVTFASPF